MNVAMTPWSVDRGTHVVTGLEAQHLLNPLGESVWSELKEFSLAYLVTSDPPTVAAARLAMRNLADRALELIGAPRGVPIEVSVECKPTQEDPLAQRATIQWRTIREDRSLEDMPRPKHPDERCRLNLSISVRHRERLERLQRESDADSLSEVIRNATRLYAEVLAIQSRGGKLIVRQGEHESDLIVF